MRKFYLKMSVYALLISILVGCQAETDQGRKAFDRKLMMANLGNTLIFPEYSKLLKSTQNLSNQTQRLKDEPSPVSLKMAQDAWMVAKLQWKAVEPFAFGPIDELGLSSSIDYWPCSAKGVEKAIAGYQGQEGYLVSQGSNRKGLAALEYLLFASVAEISLDKLAAGDSRLAYAAVLAEQLAFDVKQVVEAWEKGYLERFSQDAANQAGSSVNLLANECLAVLENIKQFKVGYPAGFATMSDPLPEQVEAYRSGISKECVLQNIASLQKAFEGGEGLGFADYLEAMGSRGSELAQEIRQEFKGIEELLVSSPKTLSQMIAEEPEQTKKLFDALLKLQTLLKSDMMSQLGLIVVFSDNDGD